MKEPLQGMQRAGRNHLDPSKYWDLGAKAAVEGQHIRERLIPDSVERALAEASGDAEAAWHDLAAELTTHYTGKRQDENTQIMSRARAGEYEREAPARTSVSAMLAAISACVVLLLAFAIQGLIRDTLGGPILLLVALLLAGSGAIAWGLRRFAYRRWYKTYLGENRELTSSHIASISFGLILIGGIAFIRAYGMDDPLAGLFQFILTVIAGTVFAFCATRALALVAKRDRLLELQGQAQTWFANTLHADRLAEYKYLYFSRFDTARSGEPHTAQQELSAAEA